MQNKAMVKNIFKKENIQDFGRWCKDLAIDTPVEIYMGALLLGAVGGSWGYITEDAKRGQIPLAFSEIGNTRFELTDMRGIEVPALTMFYSAVNDTAMQVFEANNMSYHQFSFANGTDEEFTFQLAKKVEDGLSDHTQIPDYAANISEYADGARESLAKFYDANEDLPAIVSALDAVWQYDRDDHYETVCTTNMDGDTECHSEYDYSIHEYTYNAAAARNAVSLVRAFNQNHPDIRINEQLILPDKLGADNEWAIRESRRQLPDYQAPTQDEYIEYARKWATGSNYYVLGPVIYEDHAYLQNNAGRIEGATWTARSHRYRTYSRSDSGPEEYRINEAAYERAQNMTDNITRITAGIDFAEARIPALSDSIIEYVNIVQHYQDGSPRGMKSHILEEARAIYGQNMADGFDTTPFNGWKVLMWLVLGTMAGGLIGFGADRYIENNTRYSMRSHSLRSFNNWNTRRKLRPN